MATRRKAGGKAAKKRTVTKRAVTKHTATKRTMRSPRRLSRPAAARRSATRVKPRSKTGVARTGRTKLSRAKARSPARRSVPVIDLTLATPPAALRAAQRRHERAAEESMPLAPKPVAAARGMGHHSGRFAGLRGGDDTEG